MLQRLLLASLISLPLAAQRTPDYDHSVVKQVRIDLRDLGYPPIDVIPSDESAIRALTVAPDGTLYGATSGKRSHLFLLSPVHGYVRPLGFLKGVSAVEGAVVVSRKGDVYIGTAPGGRLLKYTPAAHGDGIRIDAALETTDLGAPVEGQSIRALTIDRERNTIYGLTNPDGHFFTYDISAARFEDHGKVAKHNIPGEKFENTKNLGRAICVDKAGNAYTSGEGGRLFRCPYSGKLEQLALTAPTVPGREPYNAVDAWTAAGDGSVFYGGTSDGYLFRFDPAHDRIQNLGKPLNQYRIRGLVLAQNGKLYGVGGDDDEMARLFSYDPARGEYEMLGMIDVNRRPYYSWQGYVIGAVALGPDGTVYLGQSERKSKLYLYYPEP